MPNKPTRQKPADGTPNAMPPRTRVPKASPSKKIVLGKSVTTPPKPASPASEPKAGKGKKVGKGKTKGKGKKKLLKVVLIEVVLIAIIATILVARSVLGGTSAASSGSEWLPVGESISPAVPASEAIIQSKVVTERDLATLGSMRESLDAEYESRRSSAEFKALSSNSDAVMPLSPDELINTLQMGTEWPEDLTGWDDLILVVRAAELSEDHMREKYGVEFRTIKARTYASAASDEAYDEWQYANAIEADRQEKANNPSKGGSIVPIGVSVLLQGTTGEYDGTQAVATVALSGTQASVSDDLENYMDAQRYISSRLTDITTQIPELSPDTAALEGYIWHLTSDSGSIQSSERFWLYVSSDVAPADLDQFVRFVNDIHAALRSTAGDSVADVSLTVIAINPDDPALQGIPFSQLQSELQAANDPGGSYIAFDYPLRGEAMDDTPCRVDDLDGYLHPYSW